MRFFSFTWARLIALSCALFLGPLTAVHANTSEKVASPLDLRPIVEWNKLSLEELQGWFSSDRQDTVLEIPEGSMISLKMEIEGEFFALRGHNPNEGPTLRLFTKKKFLITKRGSKYWVKQEGSLWMTLEKAFNYVVEKSTSTQSEIEWSQDEYGPVFHFRNIAE